MISYIQTPAAWDSIETDLNDAIQYLSLSLESQRKAATKWCQGDVKFRQSQKQYWCHWWKMMAEVAKDLEDVNNQAVSDENAPVYRQNEGLAPSYRPSSEKVNEEDDIWWNACQEKKRLAEEREKDTLALREAAIVVEEQKLARKEMLLIKREAALKKDRKAFNGQQEHSKAELALADHQFMLLLRQREKEPHHHEPVKVKVEKGAISLPLVHNLSSISFDQVYEVPAAEQQAPSTTPSWRKRVTKTLTKGREKSRSKLPFSKAVLS